MDFSFTPEEESFRGQVEEFLRRELPADWQEKEGLLDYEEADSAIFANEFRKKLAHQGWLTMAWPKEYGGQGASPTRQLVFKEVTSYWDVPASDNAVNMVGPILMMHGSEEQKRAYLPGISQARWRWAQGYSEPEHGSDLASLETRAVEDGDDFVINGAKVWNGAHGGADMMFLLARTNTEVRKHRGISFFLLDMKSPGITVTKIPMMWGRSRALVTFDDVRVPKANVVGEKDMGWYVGAALLDFERSGVQFYAPVKRILDLLIKYGKETRYDNGTVLDRPGIRRELVDCYIESEALKLVCYNIAWMQGQGMVPNKEASVCKIFGPELRQRTYRLGLRMLGPLAQLEPGSKWAPLRGRIENGYLIAFGGSIGGGTSEVNRNVIAMRGLGLPRG
ncbi:MAG: acyl-CoA dehydrogenase family protein [Chloroflexi bacterium]|nr:acyl-CoA dehydrogenase family protein [Chloroflexota bacterium]